MKWIRWVRMCDHSNTNCTCRKEVSRWSLTTSVTANTSLFLFFFFLLFLYLEGRQNQLTRTASASHRRCHSSHWLSTSWVAFARPYILIIRWFGFSKVKVPEHVVTDHTGATGGDHSPYKLAIVCRSGNYYTLYSKRSPSYIDWKSLSFHISLIAYRVLGRHAIASIEYVCIFDTFRIV